jgi:hypothetical protein
MITKYFVRFYNRPLLSWKNTFAIKGLRKIYKPKKEGFGAEQGIHHELLHDYIQLIRLSIYVSIPVALTWSIRHP